MGYHCNHAVHNNLVGECVSAIPTFLVLKCFHFTEKSVHKIILKHLINELDISTNGHNYAQTNEWNKTNQSKKITE